MQSFRHELEDLNNPIVAKDIIVLEQKIRLFQEGKLDTDKFRSLRLARGVYGQRQQGVQMIRIKIPFGKLSARQLNRIADISDEYSDGNLHATTRQDIQIHYVSLDKTPELWAKLEQDQITLREACGNTVRNITASAKAGVDPQEPFDVSPYAHEMFTYFLRNPVCQEMGRKFKIAFSSSEHDSAYTFMHDLGFIPKIKTENGQEIRGFRVLIGGGLGAQPYLAELAYEFLPEDQIIPFTESVLRVFDRYGERARRTKARLKFLLEEVGLEKLMELIKEEWTAIKVKTYVIDRNIVPTTLANLDGISYPEHHIGEQKAYQDWLATNVFEQKQAGFYGVFVKLLLGNMNSKTARSLANIAKTYAADDIRVTINQGYVLRFVRKEALPSLFLDLQKIGLAEAGFDSTADITACPGTDTCNLGISSSTGISRELERVIREEYPDLIHNQDIKIKISGCPNSCGQHGLASIGFHGSSVKNGKMVLPALQVVLGGGVGKDGAGVIADKVIKIPSKRGAQCLRVLLEDYDKNALDGEYYSDYFARMTDKYFYTLLKPLTDLTTLQADDYIDWGHQETFKVETEVGECAGVIIDLFATLMFEIEEKHEWAKEAFAEKRWADSIYHNYNSMIGAAKAILLSKNVKNSSQHSVMTDFDTHFVETKLVDLGETFREYVLQINKNEPSEEFAEKYLLDTISFLGKIKALRQEELDSPIVDKLLTEMLND